MRKQLSLVIVVVTSLWSVVGWTMSAQADALVQEARIKAEQNDLHSAALLYRRALEIDEDNPKIRVELARVLIDVQGRDPYSENSDMMALIEQQLEDQQVPEREFSLGYVKNIELGKNDQNLHRVAVKVLKKLKNQNYTSALRLAENLREQYPHNPVVYNLLGLASQGKGDLMQAEAFFSKAIAIRSDFHAARLNRAELEIQQGKFINAGDDLDKVLEFDSHNRRACLVKARLCLLEQNINSAKEWYSRASEHY